MESWSEKTNECLFLIFANTNANANVCFQYSYMRMRMQIVKKTCEYSHLRMRLFGPSLVYTTEIGCHDGRLPAFKRLCSLIVERMEIVI